MNNNFFNKIRDLKSSSGFTLIEALLAITVFSIGIIGSYNVIAYNISNSSKYIDRVIASNLTQDGIEMVRNIRDSNWLEGNNWNKDIQGTAAPNTPQAIRFFCGDWSYDNIASVPGGATEQERIDDCGSNCQMYIYSQGSFKCYSDNFGGFYNGYSGTPTNFYRLINIRKIDNDSNLVISTIKWIDRGYSYYLTAQEKLYNWK